METANMMRVNARSGSFAGHGNSPHDKQQQHRQKVLALFEAVSSANLEAARQAFKALVHFDAALLVDAQFARLSKFLEAGSIYLAQQLVREIKTNWVNTLPLRPRQTPPNDPPRTHHDGLHLIDVRA